MCVGSVICSPSPVHTWCGRAAYPCKWSHSVEHRAHLGIMVSCGLWLREDRAQIGRCLEDESYMVERFPFMRSCSSWWFGGMPGRQPTMREDVFIYYHFLESLALSANKQRCLVHFILIFKFSQDNVPFIAFSTGGLLSTTFSRSYTSSSWVIFFLYLWKPGNFDWRPGFVCFTLWMLDIFVFS